jgi:starch synthase
MSEKLRVAVVSSEVVPFSKTGGLADVAGALGKYLDKNNIDVKIITPFYSATDTTAAKFTPVKLIQKVTTQLDGGPVEYSVHSAKIPLSETEVFFISCPRFYDRFSLYTNDSDESLRFALLNKAAIEISQYLAWTPHIFHCNDWQSCLIPIYLKTLYSGDTSFAATKTVLSIHNIAYQGIFDANIIYKIGLENYKHLLDDFDNRYGLFNFMKTGIIHADMLSTVSETYAMEIQTEEYGAGLHPMLQYRKKILHGIVNGVDYEEWNPQTDPYIDYRYSIKDLSGKQKNKQQVMEYMGLSYSPEIPLIGMVSRLVEQKGLDIIRMVLENILLSHKVKFLILGNGEYQYENFFEYLKDKYPDRLAFYCGYNNKLAHQIEAGADIFLMPSRYEPCGLNQIYSLKYGTIPIVRKTGGLADTVSLYDWQKQSGTGFVFHDYTATGLEWAMNYALETFGHKSAWKKIMQNAMKKNYSWDHQIKKYVKLYKNFLT